jgi:hypothetical protein
MAGSRTGTKVAMAASLLGLLVVTIAVGISRSSGAAGPSDESRVDIAWAGLRCLPGQNVQGSSIDGAERAYASPIEAAKAEADVYGKPFLPSFDSAEVSDGEVDGPDTRPSRAEVILHDGDATVARFTTRDTDMGWVVESWHRCVGPKDP